MSVDKTSRAKTTMTLVLLFFWLTVVCLASGFREEFKSANISTNRGCDVVVKELVRRRHSHLVIKHCCNYTKVTYECINGYRIEEGGKSQHCKDGRLTGRRPKCRFPKVTSCGNPGSIRHGYFVGSNFNIGDIVEYRCSPGYKLHGRQLSICKQHGSWTQRPLCLEENIMDMNEATAFIRHSLLDKHIQRKCSKNGSCSKMEQRTRRSLDLLYSGGLDVVFLVDGSNGVSDKDYKIGLKFAQELIRVLLATVTRGNIRVAVVTFNTKPYTALNFASPSDKVIKKIGSIKKPGGCGTSLGRAIYAARRVLVPSTRASSNKAMFVISTGTLNMGTSHPKAARLLQTENSFQVFAIAIGKRPDRKVLQSVVSQPEKNHVISLRNVGNVFDAVRRTVTTQKKVPDPIECGVSASKPKERNVWPWLVNVHRDGSSVCSGALINKEWVITGARCFHSKTRRRIVSPASRYTITAGGHKKTITGQSIKAAKILIHENYNRQNYANDIALVKLDRKVKFGKYVSPVCLPKMDEDLAGPGRRGFVAGWENKQENSKHDRKSKQSRKKSRNKVPVNSAVEILPNKVCRNSTEQAFNSTVVFCVGENNKARRLSCRGNGGEPFLRQSYDSKSSKLRWTVAGFVSWSEGCGLRRRYRFFTRVEPYLYWIMGNMSPPKRGGRQLKRRGKGSN
ncbi:complement C2-like isoform X1 [Acropora palmata]|uniref:complement C2-like isoform X1 n=1 Tax=Acropora palmata TaxID=6131 RepID=UPI003DA09D29